MAPTPLASISAFFPCFNEEQNVTAMVAALTTVLPQVAQRYQIIIIGYRLKRAEGSFRTLNARLFKLFIDLLFRVHVRDIDCAFKLLRTNQVKPLPFISTGAMISSELLYRLKKRGLKFKQLPVHHFPRAWGSPTGNSFKVILKAGLEAVNLYLSIKLNRSI